MPHLDPTEAQLMALASSDVTTPIVMLNLNRSRDRAAFVEMIGIDWYRDASVHRTAALEQATIVALTGPSSPDLTRPGSGS